MSVPYYTNTASASSSPYRPGTADGSWEQAKQPGVGELRPDLYAQLPPSTTSSSQLRPEPLQTAAQPSMLGSQMGVYLGPNVVTPRQSAFPRDRMDASTQFASAGTMDAFGHGGPGAMSTDTPRATHFGVSSALDASKMGMATPSHPFDTASGSTWQTMQPQAEMPYRGYAYPVQTIAGSWSAPGGMSMSQNAICDTSSSSANTSPNRSQAYYDMSGEHHFDHGGYASHMGAAPAYPMYAASSSKFSGAGAYAAAPAQPEYQPEEIDSMLGQVSTLYKTANTKKMAEFYRDKWARMWLTCNYTLKPSIQISIPRTILHESYRRACDAFGLEPLQAASFGKVLRSQFPDVAQRRLGGRGKTRFHYCGFGTSNEREAIKVKSLLEDEKAGKLQLSAGLSAEYASEARAKARSEGQDSETSYRSQRSAEASPGEGHANAGRALKHEHSPHASSDGSVLGTTGMGTDNRLIASAFATLNSAILTPPGTSSGAGYAGQDALRFSTQAQPLSQGQAEPGASSSATGFMPRRHTVSHSYSGFSDLGFAPSAHASSEAGDAAGLPSSEVSSFGVGAVSGIAEPAQSGSLLNSPASSLHGYQYIQDPRHMPSSMPFRRSCQDLPDWPTVGGEAGASSAYGTSTPAAASGGASAGNASLPAESRKAWREYESLCQALLYSIYLGPDPVSFEQRTTLFWTSLSAASREALHADAMLQGMVLRADGIIFRQLLNKLDGMIGDDVADERMPALRSLARMLAERMAELVRDALPEACATTKVQASQRMGESLERVVKIFEAVRTFREESMLDVGGDCDADAAQAWWAANAGAGSAGGPRGLGLAGVVRGSRPRSGTQSSLGSMAGPLANLQLRRRDTSVGSSLSDSQHAWTGSEQRASSSASESEVSSIQSADLGAMPNSLYAPLARKPTSAGGLRARMASHPAPESSTHNTLALANSMASSQLAAAMPASSPQHFATPSAPNSRPTTASTSAPPPPLDWGDQPMS